MLLYWTLTGLLFVTCRVSVGSGDGSEQPPENCGQVFRIQQRFLDNVPIIPGVLNCFTCSFTVDAWQIERGEPLTSEGGTYLLIDMALPESYVQLGLMGRRNITCIGINPDMQFQARLISPVLLQPVFPDMTVNEGQQLTITCTSNNIPAITTFEIRDPDGVPVNASLGVFTVPAVTREYAGPYSCVIVSTINNSTVTETSRVVIQYAPVVTPANSSSHVLILMQMTRLLCYYTGVPAPSIQWYHNGTTIGPARPGDGRNFTINDVYLFESTQQGTYTCRATNSLGSAESSYSVLLENCGRTSRFEQNGTEFYIVPGVINCFTCGLDQRDELLWEIEMGEAVTANFFMVLVFAMPEDYVLPGISGRRNIACVSRRDGQRLQARLASPVLVQPVFPDVTVSEGNLLTIECTMDNNIPNITTFEILDQNGMVVSAPLGVYSVPNVTREYAGTYSCIVMSTIDNSTVNDTSEVIIQFSSQTVGSGDRSEQPPENCGQVLAIQQRFLDNVPIIPGVLNCFACPFTVVAWQIERGEPPTSEGGTYLLIDMPESYVQPGLAGRRNITCIGINPDMQFQARLVSPEMGAAASANFFMVLVFVMPEDYVLLGISGRRNIACISRRDGQRLQARLASPVLVQPVFPDVTVSEGDLLTIECTMDNIPDITTFEILDQNGMAVSAPLGVYSVPSVTREYAGTYSCIVMSTIDNSTVNDTSEVIIQSIRYCEAENTSATSGITYSWPRTLAGESVALICPTESNVLVMRNCSMEGLWQTVADDECDSVSEQLDMLNPSFTNLTNETYVDAAGMLSGAIVATENSTSEQTGEVLGKVAGYLDDLADFVNESNVIIDTNVVMDVVSVLNSLLQWEPENIMVASSSSVVESFETIASMYAQQRAVNETQSFVLPSLTLVTELNPVGSLALDGRSYFIGDNVTSATGDIVEPGELSSQLNAAVGLPASLFKRIKDNPNIGIFFAFYESPSLFPVAGGTNPSSSPRRNVVGSQVLAATVGSGFKFRNLSETVTVLFRLQVPEGSVIAEGTEMCVTWDFTRLDWITEGCTTLIGEERIITCECNHLTNFAVLVDICLRQEDCEPSAVEQALTYISYIGTSISIVCLIFTLVTLIGFKKILEKDISKYHIQLCLALLSMYVLTLIMVAFSAHKVTSIYGGCVTLSLLVHYFTLAAVMWMGAEALLMFQKLVIVFFRITTKFIIFISLVCWSVPSVFVLVPFIVDMANGRDDASDIIVKRIKTKDEISYCFLSQFGALIGAFLVPIFVIIAINVVFFIWIIVVVSRHTKEKADRTKQTITKKQILRITFSLSGVLFLFGITWGFFILTFSVTGLRETFQILFTVFNSLQGFFVLVFILFTEGFGYWKAFLSCEKYRSSKQASHPSALRTGSVPVKNQQNYVYMDLSNLSKQGQGRNYSKGYSNVLVTEIDTNKLAANEREAFYY